MLNIIKTKPKKIDEFLVPNLERYALFKINETVMKFKLEGEE